ncbi:hypothetical protein SRHO_G00175790 [Serrasalmus rhombeus]
MDTISQNSQGDQLAPESVLARRDLGLELAWFEEVTPFTLERRLGRPAAVPAAGALGFVLGYVVYSQWHRRKGVYFHKQTVSVCLGYLEPEIPQ